MKRRNYLLLASAAVFVGGIAALTKANPESTTFFSPWMITFFVCTLLSLFFLKKYQQSLRI